MNRRASCAGAGIDGAGQSRSTRCRFCRRIEDNKTAKKRLEAYVYQLIGRWKDTRGTEYVFREDGSCRIAGKEGYFGGSGYEITVGERAVSDDGRIQRGQRAGKAP